MMKKQKGMDAQYISITAESIAPKYHPIEVYAERITQ